MAVEHTGAGRRGRTAVARAVPVGAALLLVGMFPGTVEAADQGGRQWDTTLSYTCTAPSGEYAARVGVSATLPRRVEPGKRIQPDDVALDIKLPVAALAPGAGDGAQASPSGQARTVAGTAALDVAVTQRGSADEPADAAWAGLTVPSTELPAEGDAGLTAKGPVAWVTTGSSGDLAFTAKGLELSLVAGGPAAGGATADAAPATTDIRCSLASGQQAVLGVVDVRSAAADGHGDASSPPAKRPEAPEKAAPNGVTPFATPAGADPGAGCQVLNSIPIPPAAWGKGDGYAAGYANVNKVGSAILLKEPGHLRINMSTALDVLFNCDFAPGQVTNRIHSEGTLEYQGKPQFPPAASTVLGFGFVPVSAKVELTLDGPIKIVSYPIPTQSRVKPEITVTDQRVWIRLYDVKVNGVKLDVGPNCRTVRPMEQRLTGKGNIYPAEGGQPQHGDGYTVTYGGGPLAGTSAVPAFSGCGVHEDLDNLLTASVSGPDNLTKLTQGPLCVQDETSDNHRFCPDPPKPDPKR